ncbi:bifunctional diguanylate cyclase/phosphodiesterase [Roseibium alexandrii]|uniref:PAS domain S-box/diguanylate cyclase (GGDEF) domain protein n=1 Tax=Roseibium alexandrii (strain DSM 17067 / NCIMB 14079 / DFL-11) TaxID=244592 RepID=A0A5E8GYI0_ROSAD|nr:EAL domain-containing protein [Roseibium alexandrii]EEE45139.2 PAS domain S-box/diguanylate cyclase (GGDEF) domain protein [Roseibium alexandrii DFL-11]
MQPNATKFAPRDADPGPETTRRWHMDALKDIDVLKGGGTSHDEIHQLLAAIAYHEAGQRSTSIRLFLRDGGTGCFFLCAHHAALSDDTPPSVRSRFPDGFSAADLSNGKTLLGSFQTRFDESLEEREVPRSSCCVPILSDRSVLGALVFCCDTGQDYRGVDFSVPEALGHLIGLHISSKNPHGKAGDAPGQAPSLDRWQDQLLSLIEDQTIYSRTDRAGRILDANDALVALSGYSRVELVGSPHSLLNSGHHPPEFWHAFWQQISSGQTWRGEICNRTKTGDLYWLDSIVAPLKGADGRIENYISVRFDITERKRAEARIHQLAYFDTLTGLANRDGTLAHIRSCLCGPGGEDRIFALFYIDLDHFKAVNDKRGHATGDRVLAIAAQRLQSVCPTDVFLGRLGGDEFAAFCPVKTKQEAQAVSDLFQAALLEPIDVSGEQFALGLSVGIALAPYHAREADALLSRADMAMYQAKATGAGSVFYTQSLADALHRRQRVSDRFKLALEAGLFHLVFQPQVHLEDGSFEGCEVLIRWRDEELGAVPPSEFIPIAEELGLITKLGEWVLAQTCRHMSDWAARGLSVPGRVAINISAQELMSSGYVANLKETVASFGCDPNAFELEITEHGLMRDIWAGKETLNELEDLGFRIAIDDFGTGYSSLSYVKHFSADELKIDLSFVRDMMVDAASYAIVAATIAMAEKLGMQSVAEGVETKEQADALKAMKCPIAQGYYYSRPLEAQDFEDTWLIPAKGTT